MTVPERRPQRSLPAVATVGWALAGGCWVASLFLPWAAEGALSSASLVDAARLVRRGLVDSVVPREWSFVLLVPAVSGVGLIGLAGFRGVATSVARHLLAVVATILALLLAHRIAGGSPGAVGVGGWLALAGVLAAAVAAGAVLAQRFGSRPGGTP